MPLRSDTLREWIVKVLWLLLIKLRGILHKTITHDWGNSWLGYNAPEVTDYFPNGNSIPTT